MTGWVNDAIRRLRAAQDASGGWGYYAGKTPRAEPTALTSLALQYHDAAPQARRRGLDWLSHIQMVDGGVPIHASDEGPFWPTALAALAWQRNDALESTERYAENIARALAWLESARGRPLPVNESVFGHDTRLIGWSWVADTHSWLEPTAYAVRALREGGRSDHPRVREGGRSDHPRVREGVRLILDRALPEGGWNYGNTRVLAHTLRPFPATTGIGLYALAGAPRHASIDRAIAYLGDVLPRIHEPWSLSWGLIGLAAWNATPDEAESLLADCAARLAREGDAILARGVLDDALMLWAYGLNREQQGENVMGEPAESGATER